MGFPFKERGIDKASVIWNIINNVTNSAFVCINGTNTVTKGALYIVDFNEVRTFFGSGFTVTGNNITCGYAVPFSNGEGLFGIFSVKGKEYLRTANMTEMVFVVLGVLFYINGNAICSIVKSAVIYGLRIGCCNCAIRNGSCYSKRYFIAIRNSCVRGFREREDTAMSPFCNKVKVFFGAFSGVFSLFSCIIDD